MLSEIRQTKTNIVYHHLYVESKRKANVYNKTKLDSQRIK